MITVALADLGVDIEWIHRLWHRALDARWSISEQQLARRLAQASLCLVASSRDGRRVGFCAASRGPMGAAGLLVLLVEPMEQRRGTGTALLRETERLLRSSGAERLQLGFGGSGDYFWPGIPSASTSAWPFFARLGWVERETSFDLVESLQGYTPPAPVYERVRRMGYELTVALPSMHEQIARFERKHFPAWAGSFAGKLAEGRYENILTMRAADGSIAGTVLLQGAEAVPWTRSLGERCASLSVLGVAKDHQRRGIGLALASRSFQLAKERLFARCYINWTGLTAWYGKLGATPWAEYTMSEKLL